MPTSKVQIVIPPSVKRMKRAKEEARTEVGPNEAAKEIIPKPASREFIHSLRGKFKGKGLLKALMVERKKR